MLGTTRTVYSSKSTSQVKENAQVSKPETLEILVLSGPVIVTTGTAVLTVMEAVTAAVSLPTSSRTLICTVFRPSPSVRMMDLLAAKVSHDASSSVAAALMPQSFIW